MREALTLKNMRKIIGIIVLLALCTTANAQYSGGSGTIADPYQLETKEDLKTLMDSLSHYDKHFIMMNDIDLTGCRSWEISNIHNSSARGLCIGNYPNQFSGTFNGNYHSLSNLHIGGMGIRIGLFGYTKGATIKNLIVKNADIIGNDKPGFRSEQVGILIGISDNTKVERCRVSGKVSGSKFVGGLVGETHNSVFDECYADSVIVLASNDYAGGLVGNIDKSYNFSTEEFEVGTIVQNCFFTGEVESSSRCAGLVSSDKINYNLASNCYFMGSVISNDQQADDNILVPDYSTYTNCYYDNIHGSGDGGLSKVQFSDQSNFTNWDFDLVWEINTYHEFDSIARPYFKWMNSAYQKRNIVFNVTTTLGEPIPDVEVTLSNTTRTTDENGQIEFQVFADKYNYSIKKHGHFLADISGTVSASTTNDTININTINKVTFQVNAPNTYHPDEKISFEVGAFSIFALQEFYLSNGVYPFTYNDNENNGYPIINDTLIVNNSDFIQIIQYTTTIFKVKSNTDIALSNATIIIDGFTKTTNSSGEAQLVLPKGTYDYTIVHPLIGDTLKQEVVISGDTTHVIPELYTSKFHVKASNGIAFANASLELGYSTVETDINGVATLYLPNGLYNYTIKHNLFGVDSISKQIEVSNNSVNENIELYTALFNVTANGSGIENAKISINNNALVTNANGKDSLYLPNGIYEATISHTCFIKDTTVSVTIQNGDTDINIELNQISFSVAQTNGNPVIANVYIDGNEYTTNSNGISTLYLPYGTYNYSASHDSIVGEITDKITTDKNNVVHENITVYTSTFHIISANSSDLPDVEVSIENLTAVTEHSGEATFLIFSGDYSYNIPGLLKKDSVSIVNKDITIQIGGLYKATFLTTINKATPISADIKIEDCTLSGAEICFYLSPGTYSYTATSSDNMGQQKGTIEIINNDVSEDIILRKLKFNTHDGDGNPLRGEITFHNYDSMKIVSTETVFVFSGILSFKVESPFAIGSFTDTVNIPEYSTSSTNAIIKDIELYNDDMKITFKVTANDTAFQNALITIEGHKITSDALGEVMVYAIPGKHNYTMTHASYNGYITGEITNTDSSVIEDIDVLFANFISNSCEIKVNEIKYFGSQSFLFTDSLSYSIGFRYYLPITGYFSKQKPNVYQESHYIEINLQSTKDSSIVENAKLSGGGTSQTTNHGQFNTRIFDNGYKNIFNIEASGYRDTTITISTDSDEIIVRLTQETNTYIVTFKDWDNTILSSQTVIDGDTVTPPEVPTRTNYIFIGWDNTFNKITSDLIITAQYDKVTGINNTTIGGINIYPNPVNNVLNIDLNDLSLSEHKGIIIYNNIGNIVYQNKDNYTVQTIDLSGLASGIYYVKINNIAYKLLKN